MKTTKSKLSISITLALGLLAASPLYAQEDTIVVIDDETTVEDVANTIQLPDNSEGNRVLQLPEDASEEGVENSADGLATANAAREGGREFGQQRADEARGQGRETAEQARENGREFGQQQAAEARNRSLDARERAGESARDSAIERARGAGGNIPPAAQDARDRAADARNAGRGAQ